MRYGPMEVDLRPRDQLRPLLPTWNPPPTRQPSPEELEVSSRLRFRFENRWWPATVREVNESQVKVGYDGWPGRHDEWVPRTSDRLYLHESSHPDYIDPPMPKRFQRPTLTDADGNPLPPTARAPKPKPFDPERERMKRALRPPLPYNPEKERLKRLLRGQSVAPLEDDPELESTAEPRVSAVLQRQPESQPAQPQHEQPLQVVTPREARHFDYSAGAAAAPQVASASFSPARSESAAADTAAGVAPPPPPLPPAAAKPLAKVVEWVEILGGQGGVRAFRSTTTGEVRTGPPLSGWVELLSEGGALYYWHVERQLTQWEKPTSR